MRRSLALLAVVLSSRVAADEVFLKGGGRLEGIVVEQNERSVAIEMGPGLVTIPRARVERVVAGGAALASYRERAARLSATDTVGWLELGLWAQGRGLTTQAQQAFARVVALDPGNATAQRALDRELVEGRWLPREEAMRARGLVEFEGRWMTREEREAAIAERTEAELADRRQAEAEARAREAEARAREAEARARAAEAEAQATQNGGIPLDLIWGGGVVQPCCGRVHAPGFCPYGGVVQPHPRPTPRPTPAPTPNPPMRDGGKMPTREPKPKAVPRN